MNYVAIYTLIRKEMVRTFRVPFQTLGQPIITTLLYFLVFGAAIGSKIGIVEGLSYSEFIMPGLIMMNVVMTAFIGIASGLMLSKMMNTISDMLVSPMSYLDMVIGYAGSSVIRSLIVAFLIYLTALFFIPVTIINPIYLIIFLIISSSAFALLGLIVGIWASNFEQISLLPTFLITPLTFLGGVFYSIDTLPPIAQTISKFNPFFYIINGMRHGFYGVSDVSPLIALGVTFALLLVFSYISWLIFKTGYKLKS